MQQIPFIDRFIDLI